MRIKEVKNINIISKNTENVQPYSKNPRKNAEAVKYVAESIKQFGFKVPIVIDSQNVIVAGHTRYKAAKLLGLKEIPCIVADDLNENQLRAFRLADNKVAEFSDWDFDLLDEELSDIFDLDMSDFGFIDEVAEYTNMVKGSLLDKFLVPPFSVLDTRRGYWQDRKRYWLDMGIKSEIGRNDDLLGDGLNRLAKAQKSSLTGTSIFDPVLCEVIYTWFNVDGGTIYDPFAGGSVRGVVAEKLGYGYTGIDLRREQIEANRENAKELGVNPTWYCDDSLNADKYVNDESVDLIFSCPPYADLEVYSNDERDLSNMDYEQFKSVYADIIAIACKKLKNDRFAVFVVGDIRDKKGVYRNFVDFTKRCFNENGLVTYNELVLLNVVGTGAIRAKSAMRNRKMIKIHQNVLVMYKGDLKRIQSNFKELEVKLENDE